MLAKLIRQIRCRHRWRRSRTVENRQWCDICGAKRSVHQPEAAVSH